MSNFQPNSDLHATLAHPSYKGIKEGNIVSNVTSIANPNASNLPQVMDDTQTSQNAKKTENSQKNAQTGTVFMGPLSHREETVDTILRSQASGAWSDELEAQYMENVRTRATAKVRAMLLQAKKRSDEIIAEAETEAHRVIEEANAIHATVLEQQAQIQGQFDEAYAIGSQKAMEDAQNILMQNQKALGESTAVVLLSIHQQLAPLYEAWREELRELTLEAIKVGSGWIGDGKKEEILADMLDECVKRLMDKSHYTVRVHPSDGALVRQVLENSKENSWSMETSEELEPGSLEVEGNHALVKNQSGERKRFVQEILDELILPKKPEETAMLQNVTETLMGEMSTNPLLAQNTAQPEQIEHAQSELDQEQIQALEMQNSDAMPMQNMQNQDAEIYTENMPQDIPLAQDVPPIQLENNIQHEPLPTTPLTAEPELPVVNAPQIDPQGEAQNLVESFLPENTDPQQNQQSQATQPENALPTEVADNLLSEMGFNE